MTSSYIIKYVYALSFVLLLKCVVSHLWTLDGLYSLSITNEKTWFVATFKNYITCVMSPYWKL